MSEPIVTKRCSKCNEIKPLSEFFKRTKNKDELQGYCKSCQNESNKKYGKTKKGKAAKKRYGQSEKGRANHKRYEQSDKGKIAIATRSAIRYAILTRRLPQPNTLQCHYCPAQAEEYHHWNGYKTNHRLDVIPVCIKCHHLNPGYMNFQSA